MLQQFFGFIAALACIGSQLLAATVPDSLMGPVTTDRFHVMFVRLGANNANGLLYEPNVPGVNAHVALVYSFPSSEGETSAADELASRGYRVLLVRHYLQSRRGLLESPLDGVTETSGAIRYLRTLAGVDRVVIIGWGAGARLAAFYANAAANATAMCQNPQLLYPCKSTDLSGLAKPDGIVLLDPELGAFATASDIDPAYVRNRRSRADLDRYSSASGYDVKMVRATYTPDFARRYFAAQSARNNRIIDDAVMHLKLIEQGKGAFGDDEPFFVPGAVNADSVNEQSGASLSRPDTGFLAHTKQPHALLRADDSAIQTIIQSIRAATGSQQISSRAQCCDKINYTVKRFLANAAIRTTNDFALTSDDVVGVVWKSALSATPANAEGVVLPTLVMAMSCTSFVVPAEIVYDHLATQDKTYVAVEGANHAFAQCKPEYGDTRKRAFDFVDRWLAKPGRFPATTGGQEASTQAPSNPVTTHNAAVGPLTSDRYQVEFVRLGGIRKEGLLFQPKALGPNARIALVYTFPRASFDATPPTELASRGFRVLLVTPYTQDESPMDGIAETSAGVTYLRTLPGVQRVVVMSHSGGGRMMAFYADVALNGPTACQGSRIVYPCNSKEASGLAKPDGVVLLDSAPGAINTASAFDPAYVGNTRSRSDLDMYAAANGYDAKTGRAHYSAQFLKRFYAAQSARNVEAIDHAVARLKRLDQGKDDFLGDAPLVIPGAVDGGNAASPYHTDLSLMSHTKLAHTLLKADGSKPDVIVHSVRAPTGTEDTPDIGTVCCASLNYTIRHFLANDAIRTTKDFALTEDDVIGIDWGSSLRSTPHNAEGIRVPTLIMTNTCFHLLVFDEIIYDHLAAKDKTFAGVEGALHNFMPCKPEYGDTKKRTFDYVADWLAKPGRL